MIQTLRKNLFPSKNETLACKTSLWQLHKLSIAFVMITRQRHKDIYIQKATINN